MERRKGPEETRSKIFACSIKAVTPFLSEKFSAKLDVTPYIGVGIESAVCDTGLGAFYHSAGLFTTLRRESNCITQRRGIARRDVGDFVVTKICPQPADICRDDRYAGQ